MDTEVSSEPTVAGSFSNVAHSLIDHSEIEKLLSIQQTIYDKLRDSNQTLATFNEFSSAMYTSLSKDFEKNTKMFKEMKKDLDLIFKKIRFLKAKMDQTPTTESFVQ